MSAQAEKRHTVTQKTHKPNYICMRLVMGSLGAVLCQELMPKFNQVARAEPDINLSCHRQVNKGRVAMRTCSHMATNLAYLFCAWLWAVCAKCVIALRAPTCTYIRTWTCTWTEPIQEM